MSKEQFDKTDSTGVLAAESGRDQGTPWERALGEAAASHQGIHGDPQFHKGAKWSRRYTLTEDPVIKGLVEAANTLAELTHLPEHAWDDADYERQREAEEVIAAFEKEREGMK